MRNAMGKVSLCYRFRIVILQLFVLFPVLMTIAGAKQWSDMVRSPPTLWLN